MLFFSFFFTQKDLPNQFIVASMFRFWRKLITLWFRGILSLRSQVNIVSLLLTVKMIQLMQHGRACLFLGWRKISCYFNISYEIRDKNIEFDENRNVQRAEFVIRALMQYVSRLVVSIHISSKLCLLSPVSAVSVDFHYIRGGRFSDGWGSCDRREKRFQKPNHDVPSTAETRAKNKACQVRRFYHIIFFWFIISIQLWLNKKSWN